MNELIPTKLTADDIKQKAKSLGADLVAHSHSETALARLVSRRGPVSKGDGDLSRNETRLRATALHNLMSLREIWM